jgi:hypothetical protein
MTRLAIDRSLRTKDLDGRLHVELCNISKANICPYLGREIPDASRLGLDPQKIYYLYRDPAELAAAAPTFRNLPLLIKHVPVTADIPNTDMVVGTTGSEVVFQDPYLCTSLAVWTAEAIALVESGEQEQLSSAYRYRADMTPGHLNGQPYDGVMRDIVGNHVALVEEGRAGPDVVVADETPLELGNMKFPRIAKALHALFPQATQAQLLAVDAAMEEEAMDAELTDAEKKAAEDKARDSKGGKDADLSDEEKKEAYKSAAKDKRAKDEADKEAKKAEDKKAADKKAHDEAEAEKARDSAEVEELEKKAKDRRAAHDAKFGKDTGATPEGGAPNPAQDEKISRADAQKLATDAATAAIAARDALHAARKEVEPLVGVVALDSAEAVYGFALKQLGITTDGVHASAYPALLKLAAEKKAAPAADADNKVVAFPNLGRIKLG